MTDIDIMKKITVDMLVQAEACPPQIELFLQLFGESVNVTVELAVKHAGDFDWSFATRFLTAQAWAEYRKTTAPARAEYDKTNAPAWAEYDKTTTRAWAEYVKTTTRARAEYDKTTTPARAEYDKTTARAWAEGILKYGFKGEIL